MDIEYKNEIPQAESFFYIYDATGWNDKAKRTKDELYKAIENSWYVLSAYVDNELAGFGRIISDGKLHAFIVDLIVAPQYQGKGIGKYILDRLVRRAKDNGINNIQLFCAKGKKNFYLKRGFVERPEDAPGMQYRGV